MFARIQSLNIIFEEGAKEMQPLTASDIVAGRYFILSAETAILIGGWQDRTIIFRYTTKQGLFRRYIALYGAYWSISSICPEMRILQRIAKNR
jgi:hypothetical protein